MPRYLADTSAWNRSTAVADRWHELLAEGDVAICTPVRLELLYSARGRSDYTKFAGELAALPDLPLDATVTPLAERTQERLAAMSQHRGPKPIDLLIAAIAEASGVVLLHHDRHFDAIRRVTRQPMEWLPRRTRT